MQNNVYRSILSLYAEKIIEAIEIEQDQIVKKRIENLLIDFDKKLNDMRELCENDM